jgi:hypothetical protein
MAQAFGLSAAVIAGGALTFASGLLAARWITGGPLPDGTRREKLPATAKVVSVQRLLPSAGSMSRRD